MPLRQDTDDRREITATVLESEDKCPDVIPGIIIITKKYNFIPFMYNLKLTVKKIDIRY